MNGQLYLCIICSFTGDVRNDLYLMLSHGEFTKGTKSSDRNIEVSVKVLNEKGQLIKVSEFDILCILDLFLAGVKTREIIQMSVHFIKLYLLNSN